MKGVDHLEIVKKYGLMTGLILTGSLAYCWYNNWLYYYFDILAKLSPAIAGGVTYWIWRQNRDYKNDYHKKILDKRMETYEKIHMFIEYLAVQEDFSPVIAEFKSLPKTYYACFKSLEKLSETIKLCMDISKSKLWSSKELNKLLIKINNLLTDSMSVVATYKYETSGCNFFQDESGDNYYYTMFIERQIHQELDTCINEIQLVIQQDFSKLGNVESFLRVNRFDEH